MGMLVPIVLREHALSRHFCGLHCRAAGGVFCKTPLCVQSGFLNKKHMRTYDSYCSEGNERHLLFDENIRCKGRAMCLWLVTVAW